MIMIKNGLIFLTFFILPAHSVAFDDAGLIESSNGSLEEEQLQQGMIFDRTITQAGLDFYREFSRLWSAERIASQQSLTIKETPTARYGSIVWIEANNKQLQRIVIGQRSKKIVEKAKNSVAVVKKKLGKRQVTLN